MKKYNPEGIIDVCEEALETPNLVKADRVFFASTKVEFSEALGLGVKEQIKARKTLEGLNKKSKADSSNRFICEDCGKTFSKKDHLQDHVAVLHVGSKACLICNKTFKDEHELKKHRKACRSKCDICNKQFYSKRNKDAHMKVHIDTI
jgi:uncharacterized Zn-finger protein